MVRLDDQASSGPDRRSIVYDSNFASADDGVATITWWYNDDAVSRQDSRTARGSTLTPLALADIHSPLLLLLLLPLRPLRPTLPLLPVRRPPGPLLLRLALPLLTLLLP